MKVDMKRKERERVKVRIQVIVWNEKTTVCLTKSVDDSVCIYSQLVIVQYYLGVVTYHLLDTGE